MIRTFRYPLLPTEAQARTLASYVELCRQLYNAALQQRRDAYRLEYKTLSLYDQQKELTELRASDPEWKGLPVNAARSALARVQRGFDGFFRRVKAKQTPGFPRFKGKDRYDSFDLPESDISVDGSHVCLPKIGPVKFHRYRELRGVVKSVRVKRHIDRWYVSFACDLGGAPSKRPVKTTVGIDVGLVSYVTLSTGEAIDNPRFFRKGEDLLAKRQRSLSRSRRGSKSRVRAKRLVAKAYEHIHNQKLDFARKVTAELYKRFDLVAFEDLNIRGLTRGHLAKSVSDAAWGMLVHAITCKAEEAGKWAVPVDPRGTTQRCSRCGKTVPKTLADRQHVCDCGLDVGRDHNSAMEVETLGRSVLEALGQSLNQDTTVDFGPLGGR